MTRLEQAIAYAQAGIPVFPLRELCKTPHPCLGAKGGFHHATCDVAKVRHWWKLNPNANIGCPTGHRFDAIDIEGRDMERVKALGWDVDVYPVVVGTPSGGVHIYVRPGTLPVSAQKLGPYDTRGEGGYVVLPASFVVEEAKGYEGEYRWVRGGIEQILAGLPDPPPDILETVLAKQREQLEREAESAKRRALAPESAVLKNAPEDERQLRREAMGGPALPEGMRHSGLTSLAGRLRALGASEPELFALLHDANATRCQPPLPPDEVDGIARWTAGKPQGLRLSELKASKALEQVQPIKEAPMPQQDVAVVSDPLAFPYTDHGNAERIFRLRGENLRWVQAWKRWMVWTGRKWEMDELSRPIRYAAEIMRDMGHQALDQRNQDAAKHAVKSLSKERLNASVELLKSFPGVSVGTEDWDERDDYLNCVNGTLHLPTMRLLDHRREDLLTKSCRAKYDETAGCPRWLAFLSEIMDGDKEMVEYLKRCLGYSLSSSVGEKCLWLCLGADGNNGKTVFIETALHVLGDYAAQTPTETLMAKSHGGGNSNDLARLRGARFVAAPETEAGRRLNEPLVKTLTGGDTVAARFLYGEFFEFRSRMKLWITGNHPPRITGQDEAIWRRIHRVPFDVVIPRERQDRDLAAKLRDEADGILAWMADGYNDWRQGGLRPPERVVATVKAYREEQDLVGRFLEDCTTRSPFERAERGLLYSAFNQWARAEGVRYPFDQAQFSRQLTQRHGLSTAKTRGGRYWEGIELHPEWADAAKRARGQTA